MNLHEYQAKKLFAEYGLPVSKGFVARSVEEALTGLNNLEGDAYVVKAQVHAGGRGKAGGVKLVKGRDEVQTVARDLLHTRLVTYQTDERGQPVNDLLIEELTDIADELYLGAVIDRSSQKVTFMASTEGGVEIEKVAEETPDKIIKFTIDPLVGLMPYQCREVGFKLGLNPTQIKQFAKIATGLSKMFVEKDLSLLEIKIAQKVHYLKIIQEYINLKSI